MKRCAVEHLNFTR